MTRTQLDEARRVLVAAGIPKQSYYRLYIRVGDQHISSTTYQVPGGEIVVTRHPHDYGHDGKTTTQHRWLYHYAGDGLDTWNYRDVVRWQAARTLATQHGE